MFGKLSKYIGEVKVELQKATWPWDPKETGFKKYRQLVDHTVVVVIAIVLLAGFVGFLDLVMRGFLALILPGTSA
ncbi:MAG: preprotein translocase subunit SecE [Verrucomicrobiaceae bacterium]|nr:preprotein translocase subunit SecE [Verrucomicrobiaceae bacterium]NCF91809.1 preprotein translocase subunit SecE [Verrucomicrobiaceae bacterium]